MKKTDKEGRPYLVQNVEYLLFQDNLLITFENGGKKLFQLPMIFPNRSDFMTLGKHNIHMVIEHYCRCNWRSIEPDTINEFIQETFK